MVGVVGIAAFVTLYVVMQLGASTPASNPPVVREVTSTPSLNRDFDLGGAANDANPGPVLTPAAPPAGQSLPTLALSPTPPLVNFTVGIQVEVIAAGLNVRTEPGLQAEVEQIVYEGQVLALVDGPQNVNNLEWWLVQIPDEPTPLGWAARTDQSGQPLMGIYYGE